MADNTYSIRSDKDGFLIGGAVVDLNLSEMAKLIAVARMIRRDTSDIKNMLSGVSRSVKSAVNSSVKQGVGQASYQRVVTPSINSSKPANDDGVSDANKLRSQSKPNQAKQSSSPTRQADAKPVSAKAAESAPKRAPDAVKPDRDQKGRFVPKDGAEDGSDSPAVKGSGDTDSRFFSKMADAVKDGVGDAGANLEEVDPAIKAASEVKEIVSPLASLLGGIGGAAIGGVKSIFSGGDAEKGEHKSRIMSLFSRRSESKTAKADKEQIALQRETVKQLKELNKKPVGGGGDSLLGSLISGGGSALGGLLGKGSSLLSGIGTALAGLAGAKGVKGVLGRRGGASAPADVKGKSPVSVPEQAKDIKQPAAKPSRFGGVRGGLIGTVLGGIAIADSVMSDGSGSTPEQAKVDKYQNVGSTVGTIAGGLAGWAGGASLGAAIGTAILPVFGTAVGAVIGGLAGSTVVADIGDRVGVMVGTELAKIDWGLAYKSLTDRLDEIGTSIKGTANSLYEGAGSAASATKGFFGNTWERAKGFAGLGSVSAKYEGTPSAVSMDNNGSYAYGKYQFNAGAGGLEEFFKSAPQYRDKFKGLSVGSGGFNAKWKELGYTDPEFVKAQDKAAEEKFYKPLMPLANSAGFKMDDRGVQEALFSASINHSPAGNRAIYATASGTKGFAEMSPEQQIDTFYKARTQYTQKANIAGGQKVKDSLANRYAQEVVDAKALSGTYGTMPLMKPAPAVSASIKVPLMPKSQAIKPPSSASTMSSPTEPVRQLNQPVSGSKSVVAIIDQPTGQDLSDRRIASLVTGGLSN